MTTDLEKRVIVYIDGSSQGNPGPSGVGVYIYGKLPRSSNTKHWFARYIGIRTNNEAEYYALLYALEFLATQLSLTSQAKISEIVIRTDSELLYNQMLGQYRVRDRKLKKLYAQAQNVLRKLPMVTFQLIPREKNRVCDRLAKRVVVERTKHLIPVKRQPKLDGQ
ncbi:MAG: ribonuclease HI family protein [candidate division WOR-3 bacterium]